MQNSEQRAREHSEHARMLDQLHASVMVTKSHAQTIGQELHEQDGMLTDISGGVEQATVESRRQTVNIGQLIQDTRHRGFYVVVVVLVLIIILLLWL